MRRDKPCLKPELGWHNILKYYFIYCCCITRNKFWNYISYCYFFLKNDRFIYPSYAPCKTAVEDSDSDLLHQVQQLKYEYFICKTYLNITCFLWPPITFFECNMLLFLFFSHLHLLSFFASLVICSKASFTSLHIFIAWPTTYTIIVQIIVVPSPYKGDTKQLKIELLNTNYQLVVLRTSYKLVNNYINDCILCTYVRKCECPHVLPSVWI